MLLQPLFTNTIILQYQLPLILMTASLIQDLILLHFPLCNAILPLTEKYTFLCSNMCPCLLTILWSFAFSFQWSFFHLASTSLQPFAPTIACTDHNLYDMHHMFGFCSLWLNHMNPTAIHNQVSGHFFFAQFYKQYLLPYTCTTHWWLHSYPDQ